MFIRLATGVYFPKCINVTAPYDKNGFFLKKIWTNPGLFFVYFRPFHITNQLQIEKSVDGVLGIRTRAAGW